VERRASDRLEKKIASLHRSQISENFDFKEYVPDAGSGSRIRPAAAGPILLLFWEKF
jgi:hypothetical protein